MTEDTWKHISGPISKVLEKTQTIAAIPTRYAGVNFRSRLEARWAAFFDLRDLKWDYEPIDFNGWIPDFVLRPIVAGEVVDVHAEIKPIFDPMPDEIGYEKAVKHSRNMWVLLLGAAPLDFQIGCLLNREPEDNCWQELNGVLSGYDIENWKLADQKTLWREAGNRVQWKAPEVLGR